MPSEVTGCGYEGVDDVERDDEIFVEALKVARDLSIVVDGIADLVGILAEAIAGGRPVEGTATARRAASFFEKMATDEELNHRHRNFQS